MRTLALALLCLFYGDIALGKVLRARYVGGDGGFAQCLDIPGSQAEGHQRLQLYNCHGDANQTFTYHPDSGVFKSSLGNWCLDSDRGLAQDGNKVQIWECNGDPAQTFRYDAGNGQLHFRPNEDFCVTMNGDWEGLHLARCGGDDVHQGFSVENYLGDQRFDQVAWLTAHNAHVNSGDANWIVPNQSRSLHDQLHDGVRALMIDTYAFNGDVHLCHGDCNGVPGFGYGFRRQTLNEALRTVVDFLHDEPDQIVTLMLEDYTGFGDMQKVLDNFPEVRELMFNPYAEGVRDHGWPTINSMIARNKRLLIISDHPGKNDLGIGFGPDFTIENYWSIGEFAQHSECRQRWDNIPLDVTYPNFEPLFVMNHFRDIPTLVTAAIDNGLGDIKGRLEGKCLPAAKRKPNFVAVDFYEAGGGGAKELVHQINQTLVILYADANFSGQAHMVLPSSLNLDHLGFPNDTLTSFRIYPHGKLSLYGDDNYGNYLGTWTDSQNVLPPNLNDQVSSIKVESVY